MKMTKGQCSPEWLKLARLVRSLPDLPTPTSHANLEVLKKSPEKPGD